MPEPSDDTPPFLPQPFQPFPNDRERDREREMGSHLSAIREDASTQSASPARGGTPIRPTAPGSPWVTNPPIDYAQAERSVVCVLFLIHFNYAY